jgi:hypothetical protein
MKVTQEYIKDPDRLSPTGHQLDHMQPRIHCCRLQVIWNIQYKNYSFETVKTQYITFPWHIPAWCSSVRRREGILQRPCMFQACYHHHHLYLFTGKRQTKFNGHAFRSYLHQSTHFLPCLYHFRAPISFPPFSVKTINLHHYCSNDAHANTWLLRLQVHENYTHLCIHRTYLSII